MENREQQILSEIKSMMASIRSQLERLDAKMAELQQVVDPEEFDMAPIDIDIDEVAHEEPVQIVEVQEIPMEVEEPEEEVVEESVEEVADLPEEAPVEEPVEETEPESDLEPESESDVEPELEEKSEPELVEEPEPEPEAEPEIDDDLPFAETQTPEEEDDDDLPGVFDLYDEPVTVAAKAADEAKPILNEVMAADCAWRKDMPGSPVRDIRSAISLNDRVIFINLLFKEDAQAFVDTLAKINTMETLDQAVEYICETFPTWDLNSDLVYRFMMAVRRKVK
jgi:hypothetical protein